MKRNVLWIEDGAHGEMSELAGPFNTRVNYHLVIAVDASEGISYIMQAEFDAVIVDIRLPPGDDEAWIDIHNSFGENQNASRLGLLVLRSLLKPRESEVKHKHVPPWVRAELFGVLTVENQSEVEGDLRRLGIDIEVFRQKTRRSSENMLLELTERVLARAKASEGVPR